MEIWLGVLIGVVVLLSAMLWAMRGPARLRVDVAGDRLEVEPLGLDKVWCVRRLVVVPATQVLGVRAADRSSLKLPGLRLPGTYFPGLIIAGSYGTGARRVFWDVRRGRRLLVVDCAPGSGYRQLILEVEHPDTTAAMLSHSLNAAR